MPERLDPATTGLILIDLQQGILGFAKQPYDTEHVLEHSAALARAFRAAGAPVVLVLDQLDLVKKYFDETALKKMSPATLDDLYLTVLKPASRKERDPNANLEIPGNQAALLYPSGDRSQPITRASLLAGLHLNARGKLAADSLRVSQHEQQVTLSADVPVGALKSGQFSLNPWFRDRLREVGLPVISGDVKKLIVELKNFLG